MPSILQKFCLLIGASLLSASVACGAVTVKTEHLDPASPSWTFKTIMGPSRSDIAGTSRVSVAGNITDGACAAAQALVDGRVPADSLDLTQGVFLSDAHGARPGSFLFDLGKVQPIAAFNSYSWQENAPDQGARGPQVYTLYGSAADDPDPTALTSPDWVKIATVDTRPNTTGDHWNGQYGVNIIDPAGLLGRFRYLLMAVEATHSPLQPKVELTNTIFNQVNIHTPDTLAKAGDAAVSPSPKVTDIWVVFKTHFDLGFTDLAANVLTKYRVDMMEAALKNIDATRNLPKDQHFVWTLPGWPLAYVLGPAQDPARREKIIQAVREGSLVSHAMPASLHTESLDLEDLVRGLGFASEVAREYGRPLPIAAKMTDVPCHSWVLPTLLTHAGVSFLQVGTNPASAVPRVPRVFWWEGPDGSRILCNFTPAYGSGALPPPGWPARNYLAMIMTNDNTGAPSPADIAALRLKVEKARPDVHLHFGTLDDFARALIAENPDVPVVRGDMPDTWIQGQLSSPDTTKIARDIHPLESALDSLDTHLRADGLATTPLAGPLAEAYENSMLYGEHTWGLNGIFGGWDIWGLEEWKKKLPQAAQEKFLQSFEDKRAYIRKTQSIVNRELASRLDLLAHSVQVEGSRIVVWNALPWARSGLASLPAGAPAPAALKDLATGVIAPVENGLFLVSDIPASGYKTFVPIPGTSAQDTMDTSPVLETTFFKVTFDLQRGGMASLIEKSTGRELADKTSPYALGQFLHERFSQNEVNVWLNNYPRGHAWWIADSFGKPGMPSPDKWPYTALTPAQWSISVKHGPVADVATLTAGDPKGLAQGYTITFTFPRDAAFVDEEWLVKDKTPDKAPEGGWLCYPLAIDDPKFLVGRPGGPIDPTQDIIPGTNRYLMAVSTGVTISGPDNIGTSLCPVDSTLVSLDQPGLWKFSLDFVPKKPAVFVNIYNNMWNTNFPLWVDGSWSERVRLWPSTNLVAPSWEARVPLLAAAADGPAGKLPATQAGLEVSRPGVLVTAFGADPDGVNQGTLLRVWDQSGVTGPLSVTLPPGLGAKLATPVDLRGENAGAPIRIQGNGLNFTLHSYAPASYILR